MSTKYPDLFADLAREFYPGEVRTRAQGGKAISYITARVVMNRLDDVLGPENWWESFGPAGESSILCELTVRLPDGSTITKADAGGAAGMADSGDDDKSSYSDAFKRAAVKFGIGRYLYREGVVDFHRGRQQNPDADPPPRAQAPAPAPAIAATPPAPSKDQADRGPARRRAEPGLDRGTGQEPRTGRALFAWTKEQEQRHEVGLLKYLNSWAKLQDYPGRMVDWDADQVALGLAEAIRKLQAIGVGSAEAYEAVA